MRTYCRLADKYGLPLYINHGEKGIKGDWEFALACSKTKYITLTHQDDIYYPDFTESALRVLEPNPDSIIAFSNYNKIDESGNIRKTNNMLRIKRLLLWPFLFTGSLEKCFWKKAILCFGNPICAPKCYI
ncbi:MAG: glycosyltransferase [Burkholderiales bacterium]